MQQLENDLDVVQEQLLKANTQLEEKDKALQNVSRRQQRNIGSPLRDYIDTHCCLPKSFLPVLQAQLEIPPKALQILPK